MIKEKFDGLAIVLLILLCMLFGLNQVVVKFGLEGISPLMQAGLRSLGATFLLMGWMRYRGETIFYRDGAGWWGVLIGILFTGEFLFLYQGLTLTSASHATIFLYTSPFIVALGAHFFIPGETLRLGQIGGLAIAFSGVVLAFSDSLTEQASEQTSVLGDLLVLLGAIFWGATTVVLKASPQRHQSPARVLLYQLAVSAIALLVLSALLGETGVTDLNVTVAASLLFQTVLMAFVGYLAWFWLLSHYQAAKVASFTFLTPLFGVLFAWLILDESITANMVAALILVALGIYLVNKPRSIVRAG
ncbi:DMT family transporter [Amphritea balenae]|uniref:DMT family transporter n=1 Tax=Amphritea balenae TaxID=452629 RepID=A0A3P1SI70_9GAMM|nr:DMT family transporter [Amphritea balenae]RRC96983.1 DMT family transporter [Amphritea balenae]GGK85112.1 multidrug DMT transporter permease [Amphritea balenae]